MQGKQLVTLYCIDLHEDDLIVPEVAVNLKPEKFLKHTARSLRRRVRG